MKIHFIAIGGAVMHNMAIALKKKGYTVTGSDDEIFDPAKINLRKHGILPDEEGWFPDRITRELDAVILGMHAKKGNPELDKARELGLKIYSFPEYLFEQSKEKIRVVIAGSHGKTTITSMVMHVLKHTGKEFDYLVGAKVEGFGIMVKLSDAPVIVIEGDEYLTSALDLRPKFLHYKPHIALISGIAWDHINVFPTWEGYKKQFELLIGEIRKAGSLVYCREDQALAEVLRRAETDQNTPAKVIPYRVPDYEVVEGNSMLHNGKGQKLPLKIFGKHNLMNLEGARKVCEQLGISKEEFLRAIGSFKGSARRLELLGAKGNTAVFKDFAHAPSKLRATVAAVKEQYPARRLVALMELHTYSSLSRHFLENYRNSLDPADIAVVFFSHHAIQLKGLPPISERDVKEGFGHPGLKVFTDASGLEAFINSLDFTDTNILLMSSGNFGGIDLHLLAENILADK